MATYGSWGGPIKQYLGSQSITAPSGSNVDTTITHEDTAGSDKAMICLVTTNGNCYIETYGSATTGSLPLTSSDELIIRLANDATLGAYGNGGSRTVTVKKYTA